MQTWRMNDASDDAGPGRLTKPWESRYRIENTTVLAEVPQLRVLDMTLNPGEFVPWHKHPANDDLFIGLEGSFEIHVGDAGKVGVGPAQRHRIPAGEPHAVLNASAAPARFLLIQGVGLYDYVAIDRPVTGA